jgi:hypothetical protein
MSCFYHNSNNYSPHSIFSFCRNKGALSVNKYGFSLVKVCKKRGQNFSHKVVTRDKDVNDTP